MKYLLIGDANAVVIKKYIEKVVIPQRYASLYILSKSNIRYAEFYKSVSINVISVTDNTKNKSFKYIRMINSIFRNGSYDIIHIHYVKFYALLLSRLLGAKKVVASFWGSDLLRVSTKYKKLLVFCLKWVDCITFETSYMNSQFTNICKQAAFLPTKEILFGIDTFNVINYLREHGVDRVAAKKRLHIHKDKTTVSIGYNAKTQQQHDKVLNIIEKLDSNILNNLHIILQLSYGDSSAEYLNSLKNTILNIGCSYTLEYGFLNSLETSVLRLATDIFIHAQTTDSLSSSVMEYMFSGAVVFNPVWIRYDELKRNEVFYEVYKDWEDLYLKLKKVLNKCELLRSIQFEENAAKLYEMMSWESVSKKWAELYK